ncbi:hypothetical protein VM1G_03085 [Cytospora mali]|uniref:Gas1-like protein n=1 Tax=Cytospora mali TaxID=578113 RepID=A0A194VVK8_CYTMA|nr:hypothetical protein VM1G_03085 [Valsa mali]
MPSATRVLIASAMLAMASAQGVILKAVGDSGKSFGLQVDTSDSSDANFISDAEISANVVNECGRTVNGNIDIGENTENALATGDVTKVTKGGKVSLVINQVNANGTGPYTCDLDETSNASGTSGQVPLDVQQSTSTGSSGNINLSVTLPKDMACIGSSQGNVCTVRCRNAQDYGGCIAIQQTDTAGLPANNSPSNITTAQTLEGIQAQVQQNQKDLSAAVEGNQAATVSEQGADIVKAILQEDPSIEKQVEKELATATASASAAAATKATGSKAGGRKGHKTHGGGRGRGRARSYPVGRYVVSGKDFKNEDD